MASHYAETLTALLDLIEKQEKRIKALENKPQLKEQVFSADLCAIVSMPYAKPLIMLTL